MFKKLKAKLSEQLKSKRHPKFSVMEPEVTSADEIFLTLMAGVYDPNSDLSKLRGIPHLVKLIFDLATNETFWKKCIRLPETDLDARIVGAYACQQWDQWRDLPRKWDSILFLTELRQDSYSSEETKQDVFEFPPPKDININMMPFILSYDFKDSKLPKYLEPYWKFIERCSRPEKEKKNSMWFNRDSSQLGKVCYLTIQESMVETLKSQRRPGLHVDCPGNVKIRETSSKEKGGEGGRGDGAQNVQNVMNSDGKEGDGVAKRYRDHHWGLGGCYFVPPQLHVSGKDSDSYLRSFEIRGGIFMASSVEESCRAWNCKIVPEEAEGEEEKKGRRRKGAAKDTEKENDDTKDTTSKQKSNQSGGREAIGKLGNIEHLRHLLPEELAQIMKPNRLYWMTDRTPHESLPLKAGTYRQFFRLVMSQVSLWYEDHSTPNPNGVKPDLTITKIVRGNKFDKSGVDIVA